MYEIYIANNKAEKLLKHYINLLRYRKNMFILNIYEHIYPQAER